MTPLLPPSIPFNDVGCVLRTISILANPHLIGSSQPVATTNFVMVHGMHPTGLVINWRTPMPSLQYINEKLSDAIYTLTIHEGDARKRVASVPPILKKIKSKHFSIKFGKKI